MATFSPKAPSGYGDPVSTSKSSNPFSYYTQAVTNSFTGILNNEKKHQHIRDDLLEKNGLSPSYTRQLDNAKHLYIEET